ncbi:MAG: dihydrolipoamide acetyltransferase family protein [Verrucomicrobiales bacterium]|nr:dihydrolipoamide acetyltransferase family protein [Verrucomicrobiales bacterium]
MPLFPILMPQLGESIAEATIIEALVGVGDEIKADQNIFEVETDKATMEVTAVCGGKIEEIVVEVGKSYAVGSTLAYLEATEEDAIKSGLIKTTPPEEAPSTDEDTDNVHFAVKEEDQIESNQQPIVQPTVEGGLPVPVRSAVYLSPRLRHRMEELGLNGADLAGVAGSGNGGRVTVRDFEQFMRDIDQHKMTDASPMRIAVADSMRRSWRRPLATVTVPVIMDPVLAHRKEQDPKPGITLYAMRALAIAISENTAVAGRLIGNQIVHPPAINIGFAVEVEHGVLVPIMHDLDQKTLAELAQPYEKLVKLGQQRKLTPEMMEAGIATVTNVGPFGITAATPIPLPEQNLLLGLMAGRKVPVWDPETEEFIPKVESNFILSFDHRILDGGAAGRLLQRIGQLLTEPEKL